jgi:hypothetical protein
VHHLELDNSLEVNLTSVMVLMKGEGRPQTTGQGNSARIGAHGTHRGWRDVQQASDRWQAIVRVASLSDAPAMC